MPKTQKQLIAERIAESGITNLEGLPAHATGLYIMENGIEQQLGVGYTACDGWHSFFGGGFYTIYRKEGRVLKQVQLMGTKSLYSWMYEG
jgi:hypothetical protein